MHILLPDDDPLMDLRRLQQAHAQGAISAEEYTRAYRDHERVNAHKLCETPRCGRPAYQIVRGTNLCAVCALKLRNARRGR
jgi:hypothetical protein